MVFWGIEVKPGEPQPLNFDNVQGGLYVTQATLGDGSLQEKSVLQCSVGEKSPIFLCTLLPDKNESCSLNLEFDDDEEVAFSVVGQRSIHLAGYIVPDEGDDDQDEYGFDSGEDIAETESDDSSEYDYDDEYADSDDGFIDDDLETLPSSRVPNSGVIIEEITEDDNATNDKSKKPKKKKKNESSDHDDQAKSAPKMLTNGDTDFILESEDEDGFPKSIQQKGDPSVQEPQVEDKQKKKKSKESKKKGAKDNDDNDAAKKRKVESSGEDDQQKRKKKKQQGKKDAELNADGADNNNGVVNDLAKTEKREPQISVNGSESSDKKKKKKNKKNKKQDGVDETNKEQTVSSAEDNSNSSMATESKQSAKSSQVRSFANGLIIEELAMGKPDGKRASPGSQVSVQYIGRLKKNGKIFDSNVGRAPFKFRLGVGQVIKGWDVGVNGMRVGDKRRLSIPPSMGYGERGAGNKIPPNSWLEFDVELKNVR